MTRLCEEDLRRVVWLSDPALSPDGAWTAFVRSTSDYATGRMQPRLMLLCNATGQMGPASRETSAQNCPRFSPDGHFLAFLSMDTPFPQVWIRDMQDGSEEQCTFFRWGVKEYAWSPDSSCLAVCVPVCPGMDPFPEMTAREAELFLEKEKHAPRVTDELMYKLDEAGGFFSGRDCRLYEVDVEGESCEILAGENWRAEKPVYADRKRVFFLGYPHGREKRLVPELCLAGAGNVTQLETQHAVSAAAAPIPAENGIIYAGESREHGRTELFLRTDSGETALMESISGEGIAPAVLGDDRAKETGQILGASEDGDMFVLTAREAQMCVCRLSDGQHILEHGCIQAFAPPRKGKLVFLRSSACHPAALYELDLKTGTERLLADENAWTENMDWALPVHVDAPVPGWVLMPPGDLPCPGILYVHGGPECFYGEDIFFFEAQSLCSAGYAVMYCNPRGSAGYGPEHMEGAYGREAVDDLLGFADACVKRFPRIDSARIGVTGGSYGGYMTNKLTLLTDRFRAAAAQRTWISPVTSYGTGDMGFISGSGQTDFRAYMIRRAKNSVLKDIRKLNTPTLVLHGENDVRCGVEQADQLFNCIRALRPDVPCRLVIFPGENHDLTRSGLMHNRIRHMLEIRQWMDRFLKEEENADAFAQ